VNSGPTIGSLVDLMVNGRINGIVVARRTHDAMPAQPPTSKPTRRYATERASQESKENS
jgi:hypothetical protein